MRTRATARLFTLLFGDQLEFIVFLGSLAGLALYWRVGAFITDRFSLLRCLHSRVSITFRLGLAFVLLLTLFTAGIHYATQYENHWPYPTPDNLAEAYESSVGEQTLLFGTIRDINIATSTSKIAVAHSTGTFSMTVRSFDTQVEPGGTVQVYGTLGPDHTLTAERVVVVNPAASSKWYKYAVSVLGALLVVLAFFRSWRIDSETLAFERRSNG